MNTKQLSAIIVFTSLAVAGRLSLLILPNISLIIPLTIMAGLLMGPLVGGTVGFLSFLISDLYIGMGIWTFIDGAVAAIIGILASFITLHHYFGRTLVFIYSVLLTLIYDILTSILNMSLFGIPPHIAIINLFVPVFVFGIPYPMGPLHELTNGILVSLIYEGLNRHEWIKEVILNAK
jgi:hypothetical protein